MLLLLYLYQYAALVPCFCLCGWWYESTVRLVPHTGNNLDWYGHPLCLLISCLVEKGCIYEMVDLARMKAWMAEWGEDVARQNILLPQSRCKTFLPAWSATRDFQEYDWTCQVLPTSVDSYRYPDRVSDPSQHDPEIYSTLWPISVYI